MLYQQSYIKHLTSLGKYAIIYHLKTSKQIGKTSKLIFKCVTELQVLLLYMFLSYWEI